MWRVRSVNKHQDLLQISSCKPSNRNYTPQFPRTLETCMLSYALEINICRSSLCPFSHSHISLLLFRLEEKFPSLDMSKNKPFPSIETNCSRLSHLIVVCCHAIYTGPSTWSPGKHVEASEWSASFNPDIGIFQTLLQSANLEMLM